MEIAASRDISKLSLRDIGQLVAEADPKTGKAYPQRIKFHMDQLEKRGLLHINREKGVIVQNTPGWAKGILKGSSARIFNIPIYGTANCGPGGVIAEQNLEGFVKVSNTLLGRKPKDSFFAIRADGRSMNKASVGGQNIEPGDYLIVEKDASWKNGDTILAIIEDRGLVKKIVEDAEHEQVLLVSESSEQYPPIALHSTDDFMVNGKVVQVIKNPK